MGNGANEPEMIDSPENKVNRVKNFAQTVQSVADIAYQLGPSVIGTYMSGKKQEEVYGEKTVDFSIAIGTVVRMLNKLPTRKGVEVVPLPGGVIVLNSVESIESAYKQPTIFQKNIGAAQVTGRPLKVIHHEGKGVTVEALPHNKLEEVEGMEGIITAPTDKEWAAMSTEMAKFFRKESTNNYGVAMANHLADHIEMQSEGKEFMVGHALIREMMTLSLLQMIGPYNPSAEELNKVTKDIQSVTADIVVVLFKYLSSKESERGELLMNTKSHDLREEIHGIVNETMLAPYIEKLKEDPAFQEGLLHTLLHSQAFIGPDGISRNLEPTLMQTLEGGIGSLAFTVSRMFEYLADPKYQFVINAIKNPEGKDSRKIFNTFLVALTSKHTPIPFTVREVTEDVVLQGVPIKKGSSVIINFTGAAKRRYGSRTVKEIMDDMEAGGDTYKFAPWANFGNNLRKCTGQFMAMEVPWNFFRAFFDRARIVNIESSIFHGVASAGNLTEVKCKRIKRQ